MEEEFSLSRELLPEELTSQFDVGNDEDSLFDLEEFLRGPSHSSSDDSYKSASNHYDRLTNNEIPESLAASNNNDPFTNNEMHQLPSADLNRRLSYIVARPSVLLNNSKNESLLENVSPPTAYKMCNITLSETPRSGGSFFQTTKKRISNLKCRLFRTPPNRKDNTENGLNDSNGRDMDSVENKSGLEIASASLYTEARCDNGAVPPCMDASFILVPVSQGSHENANPDGGHIPQQGDSSETSINLSKVSSILKPDSLPHYTVQRRGTFIIDNTRVFENLATQDLISNRQASKDSETSLASYIRKPTVNCISSIPVVSHQTGSRSTSTLNLKEVANPNLNRRPPQLSSLISQVPKNPLERRPSYIRKPSLTHISGLSTIPQELGSRSSSSASEKHLTVRNSRTQLSKIPNSFSRVKNPKADSIPPRLHFKEYTKSLGPNPTRK